MRVVLDLLFLLPGQLGGIETYSRNLLYSLARDCPSEEYVVLAQPEAAKLLPTLPNVTYTELSPDRLFAAPTHRLLWMFLRSFAFFARSHQSSRLRSNIMMYRHLLPGRLQPSRAHYEAACGDVLHTAVMSPSHPGLRMPTVVTCHDLQHEAQPFHFRWWQRFVRGRASRVVAAQATSIIAISDFTRRCLIDTYGLDPSKVTTVYFGVDECFRPLADEPALLPVRQRYGLWKPFLLYPANTYPHKNHGTLLRCLKLLRDEGTLGEFQLVLTGSEFRGHEALEQGINDNGLREHVLWLGHVPEADLVALYNLASALVFPSLYEGFGLPVIEAMACGCPVACSNVTALPEVAGDAALLFDPLDTRDVAAAIRALLSDPSLRAEYAQRGLRRAARFCWANTARATLEVYRRTIASFSGQDGPFPPEQVR